MDWDNVTDESIREIHRQGQSCLDGTVTLALAADQRATTLCGVFGAGAVALLAAAASVLASDHPRMPLTVAAFVTAGLLFVASLCCAYAARPSAFSVGGYEPRFLIVSGADYLWMLRYASDDLQKRITTNRRALDAAACWTKWGMRVAGAAVVIGAAAFFTASLVGAYRLW